MRVDLYVPPLPIAVGMSRDPGAAGEVLAHLCGMLDDMDLEARRQWIDAAVLRARHTPLFKSGLWMSVLGALADAEHRQSNPPSD